MLKRVIQYYAPEFLVGLTATDQRPDKKRLEEIFGNYTTELSLKEAMEKGVVARANVYRIETNIDLSHVRFNGKDYVNADLEKSVRVTSRNELIVNVLKDYFTEGDAGKRQGIIFCINKAHTKEMARLLNTAGISAQDYSGDTKHPEKVMQEFKEHKIRFLCACDMISEGWDYPELGILVMARPTLSKVLYLQQIGRGLRRTSIKKNVFVIDVVDEYGAMVRPCSMHAIFGNSLYVPFGDITRQDYLPGQMIEIDGITERVERIVEVDIHTFEEKYGDYYSQEQLAREYFVNTGTITSWIRKGKIAPTVEFPFGSKKISLFSPEDVEKYRKELNIQEHNDDTVRDDFFAFLEERDYSLSYKMPFLLSFIDHMDTIGDAKIEDVLTDYIAFYQDRIDKGLPVDRPSCPYNAETLKDRKMIKSSMLTNPFEKFERKRFMYYSKDLGVISLNHALLAKMSEGDWERVKGQMREDLERYYDSNTLYVAIDEKSLDYYLYEKDIFNKSLYKSEKQQLRRIESFFNYLYVKNYFELTKAIIGKLQQYTSEGVRDYLQTINGKKEVIERIDDNEKKKIVSNIFKHSRLGMIYGAAGTGKTKVAEHIAKIFDDKNILLLANTNAAKNNLQDRINNAFCDCYTVHDYIKNKNSNKIYDLVIVDECSTVCNEDILQLFEKCNSEAYLLLGDIHQIEAIKFGNWFNFARYFIEKNSVYELSIPYRAKNNNTLLDMWSYVRHYDENMFERLQANGYISTLDESIFEKTEDEIILCLGYDGLYGVNNINRYMQKVNPSNPVEWGNWVYKVGDKVLFNDNKRFGSVLYNNLKGTIVTIDRKDEEIVFQIQIDKKISDRDIFYTDLKLHDCACEGKSIVEFSVKKRIEKDSDTDYSEQVVPFQIAYAVSIHKAQGLEYKSVKVVITEDVDEQISHNIFYTAITRTTDKLKIYLSKETQKKLATKFVESNVGLKQAQIFAQHAGLKLKNKLSS